MSEVNEEKTAPQESTILSFEEGMAKLETIVTRLEENDVPLEKAIDLFQEGVELSKQCQERLKKVEQKMDQLIEQNGEVKTFSIQEDDGL
ncbi:exodeoxyribonuclease VII small subunit [Terrilactibacillus sp. BCM23-1]|uniref:Exodeoxyribonuclease 7 small subunit n=1 Tax=Terrilactibacillus tamarindi TaxID=2599694 RepID=A0A6N8CSL5_9BACI|nr:exodeoxyribonuclease VII small subunit [Terrilactibacillus tamarindi]MTT32690.1 exodeoxyribonuclease VII small subunit [Terrilactibacillus tamarindi]